MALSRQKKREIIFQMIFSNHFYNIEKKDFIPFFMKEIKTTRKNIVISYDYVLKIISKLDEIDSHIKKHSHSYEFNRISKVELSILRLSIFEMNYDEDIPIKVAISESLRLAKKYASMQSSKFVNAILDAINKDVNREKQIAQ